MPFFPAAAMASFISTSLVAVPVVLSFPPEQLSDLPYWIRGLEFLASFISGFAFVGVGASVAPSHRRSVALSLCILSFVCCMTPYVFSTQSVGEDFQLLRSVVAIAASAVVAATFLSEPEYSSSMEILQRAIRWAVLFPASLATYTVIVLFLRGIMLNFLILQAGLEPSSPLFNLISLPYNGVLIPLVAARTFVEVCCYLSPRRSRLFLLSCIAVLPAFLSILFIALSFAMPPTAWEYFTMLLHVISALFGCVFAADQRESIERNR